MRDSTLHSNGDLRAFLFAVRSTLPRHCALFEYDTGRQEDLTRNRARDRDRKCSLFSGSSFAETAIMRLCSRRIAVYNHNKSVPTRPHLSLYAVYRA